MMRSLFIKDMIMSWKVGKIIYILFAIYAIAAGLSGNLLWSSIGVSVLSMIPCILLEVDERGNWLKFLFCSTVTKREYVREKYMLSFLFGLAGYILYVLIWLFGCMLHKNPSHPMFLLPTAVAVFAALVLPGLAMMFSFRFGAVTGRIILTILVTVTAGCGGTLSGRVGHDPAAERALADSQIGISAVLLLVSVLLFILSYFASIKIMQKKEY